MGRGVYVGFGNFTGWWGGGVFLELRKKIWKYQNVADFEEGGCLVQPPKGKDGEFEMRNSEDGGKSKTGSPRG